MEVKRLLHLLDDAEGLKNNTRHSWTSSGRQESVAEHSWRMALMAYFVKDEFPNADIGKVILMCLCHDLGEIFTGDIPTFEKEEKHELIERDLLQQWVEALPEPYCGELADLFDEMEMQETEEAKIYKALDKMEVLVQHNEAELSTWIPLEYTLNLVHGEKQVEFSPYMQELKAEINRQSREKMKGKIE